MHTMKTEETIMRIPFDRMKEEVKRVFLKAGLSEQDAEICAQVHTESSWGRCLFTCSTELLAFLIMFRKMCSYSGKANRYTKRYLHGSLGKAIAHQES